MSAPRAAAAPTGLAAVIGSPVAHSLSPTIHRAGFAAAGVEWAYAAFDVADGRASDAVDAMRRLGFVGLSVTMPHKEAVAGLVDRLDPAATTLDGVNTVSWDPSQPDSLLGSSTDGAGFVASLADVGVDVEGARVAVIGAGGAARSVIDALARAGSTDITVLNRSGARAERAAALAPVASVGILSDIDRADLVVNATSVGMGVDVADATDDDRPCDPARLTGGQVVADQISPPSPHRVARAGGRPGCGRRSTDSGC